jgi:alkylhydroperoxidase family enzyme
MARVQLIEKEQASPKAKELYEKIEKNGARILNLYKVLAHSPDVMRAYLQLGNALLSRTELSPRLRELVILRIAKLSGSKYEWTQHYPVALEAGVTREQTESIERWSIAPRFSDEERAVLRYAEEVAQGVEVNEETFNALRQYLNEQSIVELTVSIGYWGLVARVLVPLQVDLDDATAGSAQDLTGRRK